MRVRTLLHLLPYLLMLALGSCSQGRPAAQARPGVHQGPAGIEPERGGPGFLAPAG